MCVRYLPGTGDSVTNLTDHIPVLSSIGALNLWSLSDRKGISLHFVCPFFIQFSLKVYFPRPSAIILFDGPLLHPQHFLSQNCAWISSLLFEIILFTFLLTFFLLFYPSRMKVPQTIYLYSTSNNADYILCMVEFQLMILKLINQ